LMKRQTDGWRESKREIVGQIRRLTWKKDRHLERPGIETLHTIQCGEDQ